MSLVRQPKFERASRTDDSKRIPAEIVADDERIHRIIQLLKQSADITGIVKRMIFFLWGLPTLIMFRLSVPFYECPYLWVLSMLSSFL